jgi:hypothetical protein
MEHSARRTAFLAGVVVSCAPLLWLAACDEQPSASRVRYFSAPALGTWSAPVVGGSGGVVPIAGAAGEPPIGAGGSAPEPIGGASGDGGRAGMEGAAGSGGQASAGQGGAGGGSSAGGASGAGPEVASGALSFSVLTKSLGGKYSPKNVGAIWVSTAQGDFVKTLEVWARTRARYLTRWNREAAANRVDAVSSATLRQHVAHDVSWDLTDVSGGQVAPGDYVIIVEITDHDGTGDDVEVPFTLGTPQTITPADAAHFVDMSLVLQ